MEEETIFDEAITQHERAGYDFNVTRRALSFGSRHPITGWREKIFTESTIKLVIVSMGDVFSRHLPPGTFTRSSLVGRTKDTVAVGDEIKDGDEDYYEVKGNRKYKLGKTLFYYIVDLTELPLHS